MRPRKTRRGFSGKTPTTGTPSQPDGHEDDVKGPEFPLQPPICPPDGIRGAGHPQASHLSRVPKHKGALHPRSRQTKSKTHHHRRRPAAAPKTPATAPDTTVQALLRTEQALPPYGVEKGTQGRRLRRRSTNRTKPIRPDHRHHLRVIATRKRRQRRKNQRPLTRAFPAAVLSPAFAPAGNPGQRPSRARHPAKSNTRPSGPQKSQFREGEWP